MKRTLVSLTGALALAAVAVPAPADAAFAPLKPNVNNRPGILLETDYYVYGPGTNHTDPEVWVSIDDRNYSGAVTMYLYFENRETGQRFYYNIANGFGTQERDLLSQGGSAVQMFVPELDGFRLFGPNSAFGPVPGTIPSGVGLYQFVLELRDSSGNDVISRGNAMFNRVAGVTSVSGNINGGNWSNDQLIYLETPVYVQGGNLNIEAGTVIMGSNAGQGTLIVLPGARILADGTAEKPIVFTSENEVGARAPGDWGGLVISGNAPVNGGQRTGEGDSGEYGGANPNDDSGILRYVRVEFAGIRFSETNELNGIALQGVGRGTTVEHVQVHHNQDDGIEFFGGTVDAKYVLITDARDDSFDWTFGWQGRVQYVVVIQRSNDPENDHGIEADNDENNEDLEPRSNPTILNGTWVGNAAINGAEGDSGWQLRRGTYATMYNHIVTNFGDCALEVQGQSLPALGTQVVIGSTVIGDNQDGAACDPAVQAWIDGQPTILQASAQLGNPSSQIWPDVVPRQGSAPRNLAPTNLGGFFDNVGFVGGVNPTNPWIYEGWTVFGDN